MPARVVSGNHEARHDWADGAGKTSVSILIRGCFRIDFRDPADPVAVRSVLLTAEGDYALWPADVSHTW